MQYELCSRIVGLMRINARDESTHSQAITKSLMRRIEYIETLQSMIGLVIVLMLSVIYELCMRKSCERKIFDGLERVRHCTNYLKQKDKV